jgi:hypothetical protein
MKLQLKLIIAASVVIIVLSLVLGYQIGRKTVNQPENNTQTVFLYDTALVFLPSDTIFLPSDTLYMPPDTITIHPIPVDTAAILKDYNTKYIYNWTNQDSNIIIRGNTQIHKNRIVGNDVNYQCLQPQTVITNTSTVNNYNSSIMLGFDIPVSEARHIELETLYIRKRGYIGIGYTPMLKSLSIKAGVTLVQL